MAEIKLNDMKRTAAEKKARDKEMQAASPMDEDYHYGLRLHMDHDSLEKAGIKDTPTPGEMYHIHGVAKVVHASESSDESGKRRNVEFHFHKLGVAPDGDGETEDGGKKTLRDELSENTKESERRASEKAEKRAAPGGSAKDEKGEQD